MDRWKQLIASLRVAPPSAQPWYRRPNVWLLAAAVVLPFGWILPLARITWVSVSTRSSHPDPTAAGDSHDGPAAKTQ